MNAELVSVCNEVLGALVIGGAQGLVIVACVWAALKALRNSNAATRHATWLATLLVVALLPAANYLAPRAEQIEETPASAPEFASVAAPEIPMPIEDEPEIAPSSFEQAIEATPEVPAIPAKWQFKAPQGLSVLVVGTLVALGLIRIACLIRQLLILRAMKKRSSAAPEALREAWARVKNEMPFARKPSLLASSEIPAPMVVGFLHPAIVLPESLCADAGVVQVENVFRHELAHLLRRDDWANLVQQFAQAVFFFHPAIIFVSRRLSIEREIACDDHALAAGSVRRDYALFLTEFAGRMKGRGFTAAPAAWSSNSQLKERIGMLLDGKRNASPRVSRTKLGMVTAATLSLAVFTMAVSPRLVLAGDPPAPAAPPEAPQINVDLAPVAGVTTAIVTSTTPAADQIIASVPVAPAAPRIVLTPHPVQVAVGHPDPDFPPQPRGRDGRNESIERRLDRLERMVESLAGHEKGDKDFKDKADKDGKNDKNNRISRQEFHGSEFQADMDRVKRDVEHAHREAERALRNLNVDEIKKQAMIAKNDAELRANLDRHTEELRLMGKSIDSNKQNAEGERQRIKARRQALEAQRRAIEKQLEALDKELEHEDRANEKRMEKRDSNRDSKPEGPENKRREGGDKQESNDPFKPEPKR
jgi:beta-lactamase regulating signal transducer with metallopeptidase domain